MFDHLNGIVNLCKWILILSFFFSCLISIWFDDEKTNWTSYIIFLLILFPIWNGSCCVISPIWFHYDYQMLLCIFMLAIIHVFHRQLIFEGKFPPSPRTMLLCWFYANHNNNLPILWWPTRKKTDCLFLTAPNQFMFQFLFYLYSFIHWLIFFILILDFQFFSIQFTHASIACCYLHVFTSYFFSWLTVTLLRFYFLSLVVRVTPVYCHQNFLA